MIENPPIIKKRNLKELDDKEAQKEYQEFLEPENKENHKKIKSTIPAGISDFFVFES